MASRPAARVAPPLEHGRAVFGASTTLTERLGMPPHALVTFGALHKGGEGGEGVSELAPEPVSLALARAGSGGVRWGGCGVGANCE